MLFLYNLPGWLMAVCIVGTVVGLAYPGYFLIRLLWRRSFTDVETNVSMAVLTVIATIYALLLAFVAVSVWQSFGAAETAVVNEANSVGQLARDLSIFDSAESLEARRMLRKYADIVATVEWHDMERGQSNSEAWNAFDRTFHTIGELEPDTPRREALMPEIWATANDVLNERRTRLHTAEAALPPTLWAVVLIGSALTMGTTVVLAPTRFHLWIIGLLAMSIGLVFYLIAAMDRSRVSRASAQRRFISRSRTWTDGIPSLRTHRDRTSRISTDQHWVRGLSRPSQAEIAGFDFRHRSI